MPDPIEDPEEHEIKSPLEPEAEHDEQDIPPPGGQNAGGLAFPLGGVVSPPPPPVAGVVPPPAPPVGGAVPPPALNAAAVASAESFFFWKRFAFVGVFGGIGGLLSYCFDVASSKQATHLFSNTVFIDIAIYSFIGAGAGLIWTIMIGNKDVESATRQKLAHILVMALIGGLSWKTVYETALGGKSPIPGLASGIASASVGGSKLEEAKTPSDVAAGSEIVSQSVQSSDAIALATTEEKSAYYSAMGDAFKSFAASKTAIGEATSNPEDITTLETAQQQLRVTVEESKDPLLMAKFAQSRVDALLDRIVTLSDDEVLGLMKQAPPASPELEKLVTLRDPKNARFSDPAVAREILNMSLVMGQRSDSELKVMETAIAPLGK